MYRMGCILSSSFDSIDSKSEIIDIIERTPILFKLQSSTNLSINKIVTSKMRREKVILKLRSDPKMPKDIKYFSSPPCVDFCKITDRLYLTSYSGITEENIMKYDIKLIVNVTYETPLIDSMELTSIRVPVDDVLDENIYPFFDCVVSIMEEVTNKKYSVVVHCLVGKSRSASIVLAYLIKSKKMTLEEAYKHLNKCRPIIHPNITFLKALLKWEAKHYSRNTIDLVDIDFSGVHLEIPDIVIRCFPKKYYGEVDAQLLYCGYDRETRERLIKNGAQKAKSSIRLPSLQPSFCGSLVSDYGADKFYKKFSDIANELDSKTKG